MPNSVVYNDTGLDASGMKPNFDNEANDIETLTLSSLSCDFTDVADRVPFMTSPLSISSDMHRRFAAMAPHK